MPIIFLLLFILLAGCNSPKRLTQEEARKTWQDESVIYSDIKPRTYSTNGLGYP